MADLSLLPKGSGRVNAAPTLLALGITLMVLGAASPQPAWWWGTGAVVAFASVFWRLAEAMEMHPHG